MTNKHIYCIFAKYLIEFYSNEQEKNKEMKKIILLLLAPLFLLSCVDKPTEENKYDLKKITSFEVKTLPVKEGFTTIAKLDGEIIAQASEAIPYFHPKFGEVTFEYSPIIKGNTLEPFASMSMLLCFEDLTNGDDDYNDFVCKIDMVYYYKNKNKVDSVKLNVLPIALGGSLNLGFAVNCPNNRKIIFANDVRQSLFNNVTGYINTSSDNALLTNLTTYTHVIEYQNGVAGNLTVDANLDYLNIDPYITVNGREIHVVLTQPSSNVSYDDYVNGQGRPYGLAIHPKTTSNGVTKYFRYPMEKINIRTAYPNTFQAWLDGNTTYFDYSNPVSDNVQTQDNMITLLGTLVSK